MLGAKSGAGSGPSNGERTRRIVVARPKIHDPRPHADLTARQAMVLRTLVSAYVGHAGPVASATLAQLMPQPLSPASIRNTLAELHDAGLIAKAHASAGRVPTPLGLQVFVDDLLELAELAPYQQRLLDRAFDGIDASATPRQASHLLSEHTGQLGFAVAPRVSQLRLEALHLVPVGTRRVLAVLVTEAGGMIQRLVELDEPVPRRELERVARVLAERAIGRTLVGLRAHLELERERLRGEADDLLRRAWRVGLRACEGPPDQDLVVATRVALLDQPEFADPERIRSLFAALETNQRLLDLLQSLAQADRGEARGGLAISLGAELGEPALRDCALLAMPYGGARETGALGVVGVIGPQRMDYGRVIPLVSYCSELVTRKICA
ncbi:MAG: heat-inducible transcription repressor HrcA [Spirochaetaceae bacterium]|nr:heat-inducible transcription repressor HrcA [Myxococcales bacterium]MCB9725803.1 heat-inducible transcription repressor HrcA [Spirochaetaceae bacterium]